MNMAIAGFGPTQQPMAAKKNQGTPPAAGTPPAGNNPTYQVSQGTFDFLKPGTDFTGMLPRVGDNSFEYGIRTDGFVNTTSPDVNQLLSLASAAVNDIPNDVRTLLQPEAEKAAPFLQARGLDPNKFMDYALAGMTFDGSPMPINLKEYVNFQMALQDMQKANPGSLTQTLGIAPTYQALVQEEAKKYMELAAVGEEGTYQIPAQSLQALGINEDRFKADLQQLISGGKLASSTGAPVGMDAASSAAANGEAANPFALGAQPPSSAQQVVEKLPQLATLLDGSTPSEAAQPPGAPPSQATNLEQASSTELPGYTRAQAVEDGLVAAKALGLTNVTDSASLLQALQQQGHTSDLAQAIGQERLKLILGESYQTFTQQGTGGASSTTTPASQPTKGPEAAPAPKTVSTTTNPFALAS